MLSKELLDQVTALNDDDKLKLFQILRDDLALGEHGHNLFAFRGNDQVAAALMRELEKPETATQLEIE
ncbi:MAG: hypothetical protein OXG60_02255 [Chloroflexi bacterium]|nr:hypothetical protein [Chloroflexota bacterium]